LYFWECLEIEHFGSWHGRLVYFVVVCYNLWPIGIFCARWEYFLPFWYVVPIIIWQPRIAMEVKYGEIKPQPQKTLFRRLCAYEL
jgi:hypothetical protein